MSAVHLCFCCLGSSISTTNPRLVCRAVRPGPWFAHPCVRLSRNVRRWTIDPCFPVRPLDISLGGECLLAPCTVVASAGSGLLSSWKNLRQCGQNASFFTLALHRAHCFWVIPDTPAPAILLEIGAMVFFIARATVSRLRDCPRSWVLPFRSA